MANTCKSCGASIHWAYTESGKRMPVDAEPTAAGNIRLVRRKNQNGGRDPFAIVVKPDIEPNLRTSHFVTCPNAKQHRSTR